MDLGHWIKIGRPLRIGAKRVALAAAESAGGKLGARRIAGVGRKWPSGLGFCSGLGQGACGKHNGGVCARRRRGGEQAQRRCGETKLRRANPGEVEREREGNRACGLHYLGAKLLEGLKSTGSGGNGSVTELRASPTMAVAAARVLRG